MSGWFEVSKEGLQKLVAGRTKAFVLYELIQGAWDEQSTRVDCSVERIGNGKVRLVVADDSPAGFADLSHAYTVYAESYKKRYAEKRGRFNLGEKLVLALCDEARIISTSGTITFQKGGVRRRHRAKTESGSRFEAVLSMTVAEFEHLERDVFALLPPAGITTIYNGRELPKRDAIRSTTAVLQTVLADDGGVLRKSERQTVVDLIEVGPGETGTIYEMGIPVVATGDRFHINVQQKVPLNADRDNVTPAYLRSLRVVALNAAYELLDGVSAVAAWVSHALEDVAADPNAIAHVMKLRFGDRIVSFDPSDAEANHNAVAAGYALVHGGTFNKAQWANIREADAIAPAGRIFPTASAYGDGPGVAREVPIEEYTAGMNEVVLFAKRLGRELIRREVNVRIMDTENDFAGVWLASRCELHLNLQHLAGRERWFDLSKNLAAIVSLLCHEFAHHFASNHLDEKFYRAIERFAGRVATIALQRPEFFAAETPPASAAAA